MTPTPAEIAEGLPKDECRLLRILCRETFATGWHPIHTLSRGPTSIADPPDKPNEMPAARSLCERGLCEMGHNRQSNQTVPVAWCPDDSLGRAVAAHIGRGDTV